MIMLAMAGVANAQLNVVMNVDMHGSGLAAGEKVYIAGDFGGIYGTWNEPGTNTNNELTDSDGDSIYSLTMNIAAATYHFKFFKGSGWNGGEWPGDPNRELVVAQDMSVNYLWGINFPIGMEESPFSGKVAIYPVPFGNTLNISSQVSMQSVTITTATGLPVMSFENQGAGAINVNTSALSAGLYFITFRTTTGLPYTMKIVKK